MKKIAWMLVLCVFGSSGFAETILPQPIVDKITFQLTAKEWANTNTALLTIHINATLNKSDLVKARNEIMSSLDNVARGEWHITQFERSQDSSGMEKLSVQAQARIDQANLPNVYAQVKSISKPGMSYEIGGIEFKPSLEEVQKVKNQLREQLYQQISEELVRINKVYAGQTYTLHNLFFVEGDNVLPQKSFQSRDMVNTMMMPAAAPALTVGNELIMTAVVEAASNREQEK